MRLGSIFMAASLNFATFANAQGSTVNLTSTGCYDVDLYNTCTMAAATNIETCNASAESAGSERALVACGCVHYIEMMNCYMASCWNRVSWLLSEKSACRASRIKSQRDSDLILGARSMSVNINNTQSSISPNAQPTFQAPKSPSSRLRMRPPTPVPAILGAFTCRSMQARTKGPGA